MKALFVALLLLINFAPARAQSDSAGVPHRILIVPYQPMMYFSDADADMSRVSRLSEIQTRNAMRNNLDMNIYHQLLGVFDAVSLMRATSMQGEEDLNRIYRATRYSLHSKAMKEAWDKENAEAGAETGEAVVHTGRKKVRVKEKDPSFHISDTAVMLALISDPQLIRDLAKKYNEQYILFISQFEVNTSNKNTIEWMKQQYTREYTVHYNLFDSKGHLLWAEILTVKAGNDNNVKDISDKYLIRLAQKIKELLIAEFK